MQVYCEDGAESKATARVFDMGDITAAITNLTSNYFLVKALIIYWLHVSPCWSPSAAHSSSQLLFQTAGWVLGSLLWNSLRPGVNDPDPDFGLAVSSGLLDTEFSGTNLSLALGQVTITEPHRNCPDQHLLLLVGFLFRLLDWNAGRVWSDKQEQIIERKEERGWNWEGRLGPQSASTGEGNGRPVQPAHHRQADYTQHPRGGRALISCESNSEISGHVDWVSQWITKSVCLSHFSCADIQSSSQIIAF